MNTFQPTTPETLVSEVRDLVSPPGLAEINSTIPEDVPVNAPGTWKQAGLGDELLERSCAKRSARCSWPTPPAAP